MDRLYIQNECAAILSTIKTPNILDSLGGLQNKISDLIIYIEKHETSLTCGTCSYKLSSIKILLNQVLTDITNNSDIAYRNMQFAYADSNVFRGSLACGHRESYRNL